ncbi:unnamed protein product [Miscanthus lutarioriparius]|uniref:AT-hook motif nuclear-localized protein n=1 Tax=Miscanthus lutarioriparius TaxID=422564 RepID=A0A811Q463_9POAL|nr:unnamed protein product [Miscanthus lutarioriparius]
MGMPIIAFLFAQGQCASFEQLELFLQQPFTKIQTLVGRFEIYCLSGSYLVLDDGGTRTRSRGLCIALFGPDHRVIGGSVVGVLTAAGTIQVMADFCVIENFLIYIILKFEFTKPHSLENMLQLLSSCVGAVL